MTEMTRGILSVRIPLERLAHSGDSIRVFLVRSKTAPEVAMHIPAKIQKVLDEAKAHGLTVTFKADDRDDGYTTVHSWTIASPIPHDFDSLFVYWTPGKNGGRVRFIVYRPHARLERSRMVKTTRRRARDWIQILGESAARYAANYPGN